MGPASPQGISVRCRQIAGYDHRRTRTSGVGHFPHGKGRSNRDRGGWDDHRNDGAARGIDVARRSVAVRIGRRRSSRIGVIGFTQYRKRKRVKVSN